MSILSLFYRWAIDEGYAAAEPFTYRLARALFAGTGREVKVNLAVRRTPKPHLTIKYLEPDFIEVFRNGLRGLAPDGSPDTGFAGREMPRNAAIGDLALATGLRLAEFNTCRPGRSLRCRRHRRLCRSRSRCRPGSPRAASRAPRGPPTMRWHPSTTTWALDREAATAGSAWRPPRRWGEPLLVSDPDERGALPAMLMHKAIQ
ncbi:hypothetical protein [Arthrobacter sp. Rue61a]|uniref:hypothetical protein n=1 Tax=Arthrobacter sp. Rue61a TaxID=1118963 RepID=UPI0002F9D52F|nr:hypothetical protein [Arthrobacter sp. Rue61a]